MGNLEIYIGPNGFGKSYKLKTKKAEIDKIEKGQTIELPTEIIYKEETKDSKDSTILMDIILNDIIMPGIEKEKNNTINVINSIVELNKEKFNCVLDEIFALNNSARSKDFITSTDTIEIKKAIKISNDFYEKNIGSGQASLLFLKLISLSPRKNVFLDEPEKFCHKSLLELIAKEIRGLLEEGKNVYLATHSPELIKLLDWSFENIVIFNEFETDSDNKIVKSIEKRISIENIVKVLKEKHVSTSLVNGSSKVEVKLIGEYLSDVEKIEKYCKLRRNDFIELLFAQNICLVEGINDHVFFEYMSKNLYEERKVLVTFSKFVMPLYLAILNQVLSKNTNIRVIFDKDDEKQLHHKHVNKFIIDNCHKYFMIDPNLEAWIGFKDSSKYDVLGFYNYLETRKNQLQEINWTQGKLNLNTEK